MSYLDDLLTQLSAPDCPAGIITTRDPGGIPIGEYPSIPAELFEKIEAEIGLAKEHRDSFRNAVMNSVRICWDLAARRQRALKHAALVKQLQAIEEAANQFASALKRLSMTRAGAVSTATQANQEMNNQWIREHLGELLRKEVRGWIEDGKSLAQGKISTAETGQAYAPAGQSEFSSLYAHVTSPAEDVAKACGALLLDLERSKPPRGRPKNEAFKRFAKMISTALEAAGLPSKLTVDPMSDDYQRTGPLVTITSEVLSFLPEEALPGSKDSSREVAIEEAVHRAVSKGQ